MAASTAQADAWAALQRALEEADSATSAHGVLQRMIAVLDAHPSFVPDRQSVLDTSRRARERLGTAWSTDAAPAFGVLLMALNKHISAAQDGLNQQAAATDDAAVGDAEAGRHRNNSDDDDDDAPEHDAGEDPVKDGGRAAGGAAGAAETGGARAVVPAPRAEVRIDSADRPTDPAVPVALFQAAKRIAEQHRKLELAVHGLTYWCFIMAAWGTMGVALFSDNYYGYDTAACHCVVANAYIGHFEGLLIIFMVGALPAFLFHDPRSGAFGIYNEEEALVVRERSRRESVTHLCKRPLALPVWSFAIAAFSSGAWFAFPISYFIGWYTFYGIFFVTMLMGVCRAECDEDGPLDDPTALPPRVVVSMWEARPLLENWSEVPAFTDAPALYHARMALLAMLCHWGIAFCTDVIIAFRVMWVKASHRGE